MSHHIVTVGNPNSGKTSLFNALTGANQQVGNWSGVTVDKKTGQFQFEDYAYELVDLPGIYALESRDSSIDEQIAFRYVMNNKPDLVINVVDSSSLERSLLLTLQLRELGLPVLVVLNKYDVLKRRNQSIDTNVLSEKLGCPVVALSAHNRKEVLSFKAILPALIEQTQASQPLDLAYGKEIDVLVGQMALQLSHPHLSNRGCALRLLEQDPVVEESMAAQLTAPAKQQIAQLQKEHDLDLLLADARFSYVYNECRPTLRQHGKLSQKRSEQLDNLLLNRWLGLPVFLGMMYLMFLFAINLGSAFIDFFDILAGGIFVEGSRVLFEHIGLPEWVIALVSDGFGTGIQTVATFIPVIGFLYMFLAALEASGYLARAAFVVDRLMRYLGLPGKAFVPMLMGFGCSVPAFMATRTLNSERERMLTNAMAPFMSCGARLPVYALFAVAFFPQSGQNVVFALYLLGILAAVFTGLVLRNTILPGKSESSIMEMPDYELPRLNYIFLKTWQKLKIFMLGAGKVIVVVVAILSVFNSMGTDGSFGNQNNGKSLLAVAAQQITPVLSPLGVKPDNWQATVGIITGIFAKEAVVGTLNTLYQASAADSGATSEFNLWNKVTEAAATIPANLANINVKDPVGLDIGDISDEQAAAANQSVDVSVYANMQQHFAGAAGAFAYLLFVLLYMPCSAAMGALFRESGRNWAIFVAMWCNLLAFAASTLYFQVATFNSHPTTSLFWILFYVGGFLLLTLGLRRRGDILLNKRVLI
ncbi:Fe(2+) transporter permease subunit FeoB [uncultured Tolumonas sp.]|uniref:Fe(2+) transporter permease subunit FeoB n=1 Tax=uncultured Tolumonas sp. TaxID=263765 RepID=UPI002A0A8DA8|nr:Fe(2+) transporter permease subunit FeoB [uncultured Tolumonas sp.]